MVSSHLFFIVVSCVQVLGSRVFVLYMFYTIFTLCCGAGKISLQSCFKEVLCYFWFFKGHVNFGYVFCFREIYY